MVSADEPASSEGPGDSAFGGQIEYSHDYLSKDGGTVKSAYCGHARQSAKPDWLSRAKRRGSKLPDPPPLSPLSRQSVPLNHGSLPKSAAASFSFGLSTGNGVPVSPLSQGAGPSSRFIGHAGVVGTVPPHLAAHELNHTMGIPISGDLMQQPAYIGLPPNSVLPGVPTNAFDKQAGKGGAMNPHQVRGVPQGGNGIVNGNHPGLAGPLYSGPGALDVSVLGSASSIPMQTSMRPYRGDGERVIGQRNASPMVPLAPGMTQHMYARGGPGQGESITGRHGEASLPATALNCRAGHVGELARPGVLSVTNGEQVPSRPTGVAIGGSAGGDELSSGNADLGLEFASENFGFDIDAIVDDNSLPPQGLSVGRPPSAAAAKRYVPASSQHPKGFY